MSFYFIAPLAAPRISKPVAKVNKQRSICVLFEVEITM